MTSSNARLIAQHRAAHETARKSFWIIGLLLPVQLDAAATRTAPFDALVCARRDTAVHDALPALEECLPGGHVFHSEGIDVAVLERWAVLVCRRLQTEAERWNRMADVIAGILGTSPEEV